MTQLEGRWCNDDQDVQICRGGTQSLPNCHSVDDHNAKRHSPISIEVVWASKQWPNCVFAFLFVITEVNRFLSESCFTSWKHDSMMDYRKELTNLFIENQYLLQEELTEKQRSARIWQEISHGLVLLPPF